MADFTQVLRFSISGLPAETFSVFRMQGEEAISRLFRFDIDLVSDDPQVGLRGLTNRQAVLEIERIGESRRFCGIVLQAEQVGATPNGRFIYKVTLVPRLHRLTMSRQNQIHGTTDPATVVEVISAELSAAKLKGPAAGAAAGRLGMQDFGFHVTQTYPTRDYVVQYEESDFDFIARLAEQNGIFFFFTEEGRQDVVVFGDARTAFPLANGGADLPYRPDSGLTQASQASVASINCTVTTLPEKVYLRDFNYRLPDVALLAEAVVDPDGHGAVVEYGNNFRTPEEGQRLAKVRAEELLCRQTSFAGTSDCIHLSAGHVFALAEHFRTDFNIDHLVVAIRHQATQALPEIDGIGGMPRVSGYRNAFESVPASVEFRPERVTRKPVMAGLGNAVVDAAGPGDRADIDEQGRYTIRQYFDLRDESGGKASRLVRKVEPYGGRQYGMHFPLLKGSEVVVAHVNGDPDRPMIVGAVPNPRQESMVTATNRTKNRIRTPSGVAIEVDDGPTEQERVQESDRFVRMLVPGSDDNRTQAAYMRLGVPAEGPDSADTPAAFRSSAWPSVLSQKTEELGAAGHLLFTKGDNTVVAEGSRRAQVSGDDKRVVGGSAFTFIGEREEKIVAGDVTKDPLPKIPFVSLPTFPWSLISYKASFVDPYIQLPTTVAMSVGSSIGLTLGNATSLTLGTSQAFWFGAKTLVNFGIVSTYNTTINNSVSASATLSTSLSLTAALQASLKYSYAIGQSIDYVEGKSRGFQTDSWSQRVQPTVSPAVTALRIFNLVVMAAQALLGVGAVAIGGGYAAGSVAFAAAANAGVKNATPVDLTKNPLNAAGIAALGGTTALNFLTLSLQIFATVVGVFFQLRFNQEKGTPSSEDKAAEKALDDADKAQAAASAAGSGGTAAVKDMLKQLAETAAEEAKKISSPSISLKADPLEGIVLGYDDQNYIKITPLGIEIFATQVSVVAPILQSFGTRKHAGPDGVWGVSHVYGWATASSFGTGRLDALSANITALQAPGPPYLVPAPPLFPIPDAPPVPPAKEPPDA